MARANRRVKRKASKTKKEAVGSSLRLPASNRQHEVFGIIFMMAALVVLLSLSSFTPLDPVFESAGHKASNLVGYVGAYLADGLLRVFGVSAFLVVLGLGFAALVSFTRGGISFSFPKVAGAFGLAVMGTALCHIVLEGSHLMGHAPGGLLGEYAGGLFVVLFSKAGSMVILSTGCLLALIATTGFSIMSTCRLLGRGMRILGQAGMRALSWSGRNTGRALAQAGCSTGNWLKEQGRDFIETMRKTPRSLRSNKSSLETESETQLAEEEASSKQSSKKLVVLAPPVSCPPPIGRREPVVVTSDPPPLAEEPEPALEIKAAKKKFKDIQRNKEPEIVIPKPIEEEDEDPGKLQAKRLIAQPSPDYKDFELPSIEFLYNEEQHETEVDKGKLHEYARRLEEKLNDYGIQGRVAKIMPGPVVTMYEYAPGPGIKVAKIAGLSQDLALALEAFSVRIVAPIPGRAVVGIEVSNKTNQTVYAKQIIGHKSFVKNKSKLTMALGKNIEGVPYVADLNKMPHLLVAGATGTGKSVALNCMIASILYKATPEDVRFIMVDPKVLELSLYEGIPHLLLPVVTDPRKAQAALQWAVNEMERRIRVLYSAGVRNLDSYNKKVEAHNEKIESPEAKTRKKITVIDKTAENPEDEILEVEVSEDLHDPTDDMAEAPTVLKEKLPHIVIVIDELADLMMTASREVETNIARIAQKARAAGIHLIVATQRPSVNVITGLIKANLPARVSFRVSAKVDSRTILDSNGAETLLGNGDMLFHPPTTSQLIRIHGALITEDEITEIVDHLKKQGKPVYDKSILASAEEENDIEDRNANDHDDLYDMAVGIVAEMGQASTSMVQRKLRIGYNRAARMIERMEREGIVGPPDGSKPRQVLIQNHLP